MSYRVPRPAIIVAAIGCTLVLILLAVAPARLARQARTTAFESPDTGAGFPMAVFSTEQPGLEAPEGLEAVAVDATPPPPVVNPDVAVPAGQGACYIYQASLPTDPVQVGTICSIRTQQDCHASANPHAYIFLEGVPCTQPLPQCGNAQVVVNEVGTAIHANPNVSRNQARDMCNNAVTRDVAAFACPQNCRAGAAHFRWLEEVSELIMSQTLTQTTARCAALIRCYPAPPPSPELLWH